MSSNSTTSISTRTSKRKSTPVDAAALFKAAAPKFVIPSRTTNFGLVPMNIYLVGCGGTGSHLASNLAAVMSNSDSITGSRIASLTLIDGDTVEPSNCGRQLFSSPDIGRPKAEVLALRYTRAFNLQIAFVNTYFKSGPNQVIPEGTFNKPTLIVTAVDKASVRLDIFNWLCNFETSHRQSVFWMDIGNGHRNGQIGIGNTCDPTQVKEGIGHPFSIEFLPYLGCLNLFSRTIDPRSDEDEIVPGGCVEQVRAQLQSENVNRIMAALAMEMLSQLLEGKLNRHYLSVDLNSFSMLSQPITETHLQSVFREMKGNQKAEKTKLSLKAAVLSEGENE